MAVRDISDSSLIVRLTRGRGWIAVLCVLLGGIVALNVISLSLNTGVGQVGAQIEELERDNSALRAELAEQLSASRVEAEAARLGLAVPDPREIRYLRTGDSDAEKLVDLLGTDTFLAGKPSDYAADPGQATYEEPAPAPSVTPSPAPSAPTASAPAASGEGSTAGSGGVGL